VKAKKHSKRESAPRSRRHAPIDEQAIAAQVKSLAEPLCNSEGLELIHVEFQREATGRILRLYIDKPEGIDLDDCAGVSRQLGDLLDVDLADIGPYSLEVTSPGSERPLARQKDFEKFKGNRTKIRTSRPLSGQKNFTGVLLGISGDQVQLQIGQQVVAIPYKDILKARIAAS
jgi:ribosome maturation factor RimP